MPERRYQLDAASRAWLVFGQEAEEARRQLLTAAADMFSSIQSPEIGDNYGELRQLADICQPLTATTCGRILARAGDPAALSNVLRGSDTGHPR
ncbi:hypothetical protein [Rhodococcus sp. SG20037]|uniref:hypothetical protein n=1 Tax=Rhodococcus sp. SG20037 TaxID=3074148 RepID=UPI00287FB4BC|nr:hypothetical protein [Rhodococcus sp. SG20037]WNF44408.1 hypothetical protein RHP72_13815 [Rhodococcus sp. SG20037]